MKDSANGKRSLKYRTSLMLIFILSISVVLLSAIYSNLSSKKLIDSMSEIMTQSRKLSSVYKELDAIQQSLEAYLTTGSSDSLLTFYSNNETITRSLDILSQTAEFTGRGIKIKNVINMVGHYLATLENAVNEKRWRNIDGYTAGYYNSLKEYNYIGSYIQEIMSNELNSSAEKFTQLQETAARVNKINNILIATTVLLVMVIIILFSFEITRPITKLASYSREVSEGNFDVEIEPDRTFGEIDVLYQAFRVMTANIRKYVNTLKEKQRLEITLSEEKLANLRMKSALHEAELLALQSQVNPHFIFNTINIGAKIAMLQGDDVTCSYLENAADIYRYNLKGLDYHATLQDEFNNAISYLKLLQTRFGDSLRYSVDIEEDVKVIGFTLPRMTIQPLIENAYIHGVSKLEDGGEIKLSVQKAKNGIRILVSNTGEDISPETIRMILDSKSKTISTSGQKGHTTGIGMDNVLARLRLFYNTEDVMEILCDGGNTHFILKLPFTTTEWRDDDV